MNTDDNRLVSGETYDDLAPEEKEKFTLVPKKLHHAAKRKLNGRAEAMVSKTSGGKLSRWAAKKRKRKAAQRSRRRNRK